MWSFSDDEQVILKETFKDRDSVHKQLLKSELGPGSVEIDGRIKKAFWLHSPSTALYWFKRASWLCSG